MAGYDVTVGKDLLPGLLSGQDGSGETGRGGVEPDTGGAGAGESGCGSAGTFGRAPGLR